MTDANGNTSDMMGDINRFAAIWDSALEKGIFKDATPKKEVDDSDAETDFFGQYLSDDYDMDQPLNEVDTKYWAQVSRLAGQGQYVDPFKLTEAETAAEKNVADVLAKAHNPIEPTSVGKDQDVVISQNWGIGGKEHFQLEELKVRLEKLESKLNSLEGEGKAGTPTQGKIDGLKKQIDDLSNSLGGDRFSNDG